MYYTPLMREELEQKRLQMRKGLVEFCILLAVAGGRMYSSDILKKLKDADLLVVEGTLYPLLSRLRSQGLLEHEWEESKAGPPRKYYSLTKLGKETLASLQKTWKELAESVASLT
jgi:PadR family transcriptional regulator, regulatory protein PadR